MPVPGEARSVKEIVDEALASLPPDLRSEAMTHVSYANEKGPAIPPNERLEFLGDAVLYLSVAHSLFLRYPAAPEGDLTRMRAAAVSGQNLASVALSAGLGERVKVGRGEEQSGGRSRPRLLAGALEALLGAVYIARGWDAAHNLVSELLMKALSSETGPLPAFVPVDPKTLAQEMVQKQPGTTLEYRVVAVDGPDHSPVYTVACVVGGVEVSRGHGQSKKEAEEAAAAGFLARGSR
ncbi:MAG: ribonuclease III [Bacillota bacterium]